MARRAPPADNLPKLAAPAQRALARAGVGSLRDLARFSEKDLASWHGIGPNAMAMLRRAMSAQGLSFATDAAGRQRRPRRAGKR